MFCWLLIDKDSLSSWETLFGERPEVVIEMSALGAPDIALSGVQNTCSPLKLTRYLRHIVHSSLSLQEKETRIESTTFVMD